MSLFGLLTYTVYLNIVIHLIRRKKTLIKLAGGGAALAVIFCLRIFAEHASVDDLRFFLLLPAVMTEFCTGLLFYYVPGTGYVCANQLIVINEACSGIHFLIICLVLALFLSARYREGSRFLFVLFITGIISVFVAQTANGLRIILSIIFYPVGQKIGFLQGADFWLHTSVGTFVFLLVLLGYYFGLVYFFTEREI